MPSCTSIDPLVTPYIDGELAAAEREIVQQHLHACPPCLARVRAEEAVQRLLVTRKPAFHAEQASPALRVKCGSLTRGSVETSNAGARAGIGRWPTRLAPLMLAATLVLIVGGAFIYQVTARSPRVMAAELTADHLKCFAMNSLLGTQQTPAVVEGALASGFGWETHLPARAEDEGLSLVGSRPCLYGEGRTAHIMYRHNGRPVSLFMLPRRHSPEVDETIRVLGHEASIWSVGDRTFVLIAQEAPADVEHLAAFVRASMH